MHRGLPGLGSGRELLLTACIQLQEEEPGLKMLPSAFLEDLEGGHKTFAGILKTK